MDITFSVILNLNLAKKETTWWISQKSNLRISKLENIFISQVDQEGVDAWGGKKREKNRNIRGGKRVLGIRRSSALRWTPKVREVKVLWWYRGPSPASPFPPGCPCATRWCPHAANSRSRLSRQPSRATAQKPRGGWRQVRGPRGRLENTRTATLTEADIQCASKHHSNTLRSDMWFSPCLNIRWVHWQPYFDIRR